MAENPNELDYSRKVADGERLELIMRQVASRFKLDGNVLAEALLDIHERLKAVEGATEELTAPDRWKAFKTVQLAKPSPSASGDTVTAIDTVAQDENGELTATKKNIRQGTTSQKGIVQLSDATNSTSTALAATANAVKTAYDLAASKQDALGISSSGSSAKFLNEKGEWTTVTSPDVSGKADKVTGATAGDVATLDANGNLVDSDMTLGKSVPADAAFTDDKVAQMKADSSDTAYPLLMAGAADPNGTATTARYDSGVTLNPSTNTIAANISGNAETATTAASADTATATSSGSIPADADLNNYNTANRYYLCNAANAPSVSNRPTGASGAFELEVIRGTSSSCVQVYYSRDDVNFNYIRKCTGLNDGTWTGWVKLVDSSDLDKSAGDLEHPCYVSRGKPVQCYGVSTYSLFAGTFGTSWTSISGAVSPSGSAQYTLTDNASVDLRKTGGTTGNTGCMRFRVKGDGNGCRTLTVQYLDAFGNSRSFEIYWGNSSHFTRVNEFVVFWSENLFPLNHTVYRHCTIVPVRLRDLFYWDGEQV